MPDIRSDESFEDRDSVLSNSFNPCSPLQSIAKPTLAVDPRLLYTNQEESTFVDTGPAPLVDSPTQEPSEQMSKDEVHQAAGIFVDMSPAKADCYAKSLQPAALVTNKSNLLSARASEAHKGPTTIDIPQRSTPRLAQRAASRAHEGLVDSESQSQSATTAAIEFTRRITHGELTSPHAGMSSTLRATYHSADVQSQIIERFAQIPKSVLSSLDTMKAISKPLPPASPASAVISEFKPKLKSTPPTPQHVDRSFCVQQAAEKRKHNPGELDQPERPLQRVKLTAGK